MDDLHDRALRDSEAWWELVLPDRQHEHRTTLKLLNGTCKAIRAFNFTSFQYNVITLTDHVDQDIEANVFQMLTSEEAYMMKNAMRNLTWDLKSWSFTDLTMIPRMIQYFPRLRTCDLNIFLEESPTLPHLPFIEEIVPKDLPPNFVRLLEQKGLPAHVGFQFSMYKTRGVGLSPGITNASSRNSTSN